ncbi:MAG: ABC transporter permease [Anaerolineales bacterium]
MSPLALLCTSAGIFGLALLAVAFARGSQPLRRYIITRVALTIPMVFILASVVFLVMRVLPGDPVTSSLGPRGTEELREQLREQLGLNDPLIVQYGRFLWNTVRLDFGTTLVGGNRPIVDDLGERLPATLELVLPAMALALLIGVVPGAIAGHKRKSPLDYSLRLYSIVIYSMPIFWLGLLLQLFFSVQLDWTPIAGRMDPQIRLTMTRDITELRIVDALLTQNWPALFSALHYLVLPVMTLALALSGVFVRLTRINLIEVLQEDYITAARARGIYERVVVYGHGLKNAFIPIVTLVGLQFAILLAGAILTETVFSWPGMARYLVDGIRDRDYPIVQGVIIVFALMVSVISLAVDILYAYLDPRIRY